MDLSGTVPTFQQREMTQNKIKAIDPRGIPKIPQREDNYVCLLVYCW